MIKWRLQSEAPQIIELIVDETVWKCVYKSLFNKHLHKFKECSSMGDLEETFRQVEEKVAKLEAFRLLASRGRFSEEIFQKLSEKGISTTSIDKALDECRRLGVLDDQREMGLLVSRLQKKGYGPRFIGVKIKARTGKFGKVDGSDQEKQIRELLQKRFKKFSLDNPNEKRKVVMALQRRGFDLESIFSVLNVVFKN